MGMEKDNNHILPQKLYINQSMSITASTQSKLKSQLEKEQCSAVRVTLDDDRIDNIFEILTKKQLKNLMLIELLTFLIEKGFVKYEHKVHYFMDLYDSIRGHSADDTTATTQKIKVEEEDKFNRKKFVKLLKQVAKKMYPCDDYGFENNIFKIITGSDSLGEVRMKTDENVKKILERDTINALRSCERELELVFEMYMPENFNKKLSFSWQEIKYLEKKLPIMSVFRFLWDCDICPQHISPTAFLEIASKLIPPHSLLAQSGQKQVQFYNSENIINYIKEPITQKKIKLLEGDIGVNYFEFQIFLVKLSTEISKEKNDFTKAFETFLALSRLKEIISSKGESRGRPNRFEETVKGYLEENRKNNNKNLCVQKTETKRKIDQVIQEGDEIMEDEAKKFEFRDQNISLEDLMVIKKAIEEELPPIPQRPKIEKENDRNYKVEEKNIVIGEQLPKIPDKNKPAAPPKKNDKKDEQARTFKFQEPSSPKISSDYYKDIVKVPKKPRVNTEYPILLLDAVYPSDIPNLYISPKSEIYLETTYIHLGERSYKKAFNNYMKARTVFENSKNHTAEFFFHILQAQIYEAAARDGMALLNYYKAKQLTQNNKDITFKYIVYKGLGCCLYHMQEYEYALRCFIKAKSLKDGLDEDERKNYAESVERAVIENNIGCALMILNRNNQAMERFSVSEKIMDLRLGKFHERSIAVQQNERKNKKAFIEMVPQFKTMWKTFEEKPGLKPAPQKKK